MAYQRFNDWKFAAHSNHFWGNEIGQRNGIFGGILLFCLQYFHLSNKSNILCKCVCYCSWCPRVVLSSFFSQLIWTKYTRKMGKLRGSTIYRLLLLVIFFCENFPFYLSFIYITFIDRRAFGHFHQFDSTKNWSFA